MGYVASSVDGVPGAIHPIVISDTAGSALRDQSDGGHHAGGLPSWKQAMALLAGSGSAPKGSQGWSERAHAFAAIAEHLRAAAGGADGNGGASANGAVQELVKDFPALQARALEALDDVSGHFKVVSSALEAVKEALPLAPGAFEGGVDRLMPALFGKLVDKKDQIRCLAQDTLQGER